MDRSIKTKMDGVTIRYAEEKDIPVIFKMIKGLAVDEKATERVFVTEEILYDSIFIKKYIEAILCEYNGREVAFAFFFTNFSVFLGLPGIYLEALYVLPEMRGKGIGTVLLKFLSNLAVKRGCARLEWLCLDWNEAAINLYRKLGCVSLDEWTIYREAGEALKNVADQF